MCDAHHQDEASIWIIPAINRARTPRRCSALDHHHARKISTLAKVDGGAAAGVMALCFKPKTQTALIVFDDFRLTSLVTYAIL